MCSVCIKSAPFNFHPRCVICNTFCQNGFTHVGCLTFFTPEKLLSPFLYEGVIKKLIVSSKFGQMSFYNLELLTKIALDLTACSFLKNAVTQDALIVPVPSSKDRLHARGFNPADVIAKALSEHKFCPFLVRKKKTLYQSELSKAARFANVGGAFEVPSAFLAKLKGQDVILVDDLCTSGATFIECAKVLKAAGARFVMCFSLARASDFIYNK